MEDWNDYYDGHRPELDAYDRRLGSPPMTLAHEIELDRVHEEYRRRHP